MNQVLEQLSKLGFAQKVVILVALMGVIGALYYFMLYSPLEESLKKQLKTQNDLNEKLMENRAIAKNKEKFREELAVLDEELKQAITLLPNDKDIRSLLRQMSIIQKKTNVNSMMFKPGNETPKSFYAEIPIQLRLEGSYHDIALFFDKVGKLERIVNISDIEFGAPKTEDGQVILDVNCTATTFQYKGAGGMPAAEPPAEAGRG